ncbi:hypothetical protein CI610_03001 [invertebrate metagenome]|uniref:DUF2505 domain-containing protein n=1 Tax=invertebrate metagenome TaxID=1711999 RepID=A0A2H9T4E0_9ZZZZ
MNITQNHIYNRNMEEVLSLFGDAQFMQKKYTALGAKNIKIRKLLKTDNSLTIDTRREVPVSDNTPSVIKRFIGERNRTRQKEEWSKQGNCWQCQLSVDISGVPARIKGSMVLSPTEAGCENRISITIDSSIPFIGETLCRFIGDNMTPLIEQEYTLFKDELNLVAA